MKIQPGSQKVNLLRECGILFKQQYRSELRSGNNISGLLLYSLSTVFVCYWALKHTEPAVWNAVFWIILMFAGINAVSKSFLQESKGRSLYFYTLASSTSIIISRLLYNSALMLVISYCSLALYSLLLISPVQNLPLYLFSLFLGSVSLSSVFTLISAIASRAGNSMTLMAVLGIPMLLPLMFLLIRFSFYAIETGTSSLQIVKDGVVLGLLNLVLVSVTLLVFPYIWRE